jgi:hypothetical protein
MYGRVRILVAAMFGGGLLLACGGSNESQQAAYPIQPQGQPGAAQPGAPGAQPGMTAQPTQPGATAVQPGAVATQPGAVATQPAATPAANAQEVDASMAAPVQPILQQLAKTQAPPGAKPMGNLIVANFAAPGQKFEKQVQLTANKCYTVVAAGAPGVAEINLKFVSPLIPLAPPAAVDNTSGPQATLGPNPNCWKQIMFSGPMNLVIEVPQGQGLVGAQIYEK